MVTRFGGAADPEGQEDIVDRARTPSPVAFSGQRARRTGGPRGAVDLRAVGRGGRRTPARAGAPRPARPGRRGRRRHQRLDAHGSDVDGQPAHAEEGRDHGDAHLHAVVKLTDRARIDGRAPPRGASATA